MLTPEEIEQIKNATPEQQLAVKKVLRSAQLGLLGISAKFALGIFGANLLTIFFGAQFFQDSDPQILLGFQIVAMILNFLFMSSYLNGQIKQNGDMVKSKINEIFKQQ